MDDIKPFTAKEVAEILSMSYSGVYTAALSGRIPGAFRVGKRLLFRRQEFLSFVTGKPGEAASR